jgi:AhpC/TSA family protein
VTRGERILRSHSPSADGESTPRRRVGVGLSEAQVSLLKIEMEANMALKVGDVAPDFTLKSATGETQGDYKLSDQRAKNVVICFYALDFTPV